MSAQAPAPPRPRRRLAVSWLALGLVALASLVAGITGDTGPSTNQERVYEIASTLRCPQCAGQSVADSDAPIAVEIRATIATLVAQGLGDDQIRDQIAAGYEEDIRLEPPSRGVAGLVWVIPVAVIGIATIWFVIRLGTARRAGAEPADASVAPADASVAPADATVEPAGAERGRRRWLTAAWVSALAAVVALSGFVTVSALISDDGAGPGTDPVGELLVKADECVTAGDAECAIEAYDEVLRIEPQNPEALTYQAALFHREGESQRALEQLRQVTEMDPTFLDAWAFDLVIREQLDELDAGLAELAALVQSGDVDIALGVAEFMVAEREPVLALEVYDTVLALQPSNATALAWRGWVVALAGLDEEAISYLDRAVESDPSLPEAHAFRAIVLDRLGRRAEAADALEAFDASDPPAEMQAIVEGSGLRERLAGEPQTVPGSEP